MKFLTKKIKVCHIFLSYNSIELTNRSINNFRFYGLEKCQILKKNNGGWVFLKNFKMT